VAGAMANGTISIHEQIQMPRILSGPSQVLQTNQCLGVVKNKPYFLPVCLGFETRQRLQTV
ncbi:MAG: hypothetical protein LBB76_07045, partial [Azoarcus sp.]|nr:hypothetical protein [Azoarcus sp.]